MVPVFGIWPPIKPKLLRRVHDRLDGVPGCETVLYRPSKRDPHEVVTEIDSAVFLARDYSAEEAKLRVEFDLSGDRPHYWIQWWEPGQNRSIGWHADDTEPELGPIHLQIEYPDGTIRRDSAEYVEDEHPYRAFKRRLADLPKKIDETRWK